MQQTNRRLVLWDIDGTLTHAGSVATDVFFRAVEEVVGRPPSGTFSFSGKTDRQITEELLSLAGSEHADHAEEILVRVERGLAARSGEIAAEGRAHAGAREAIEAFATLPGVTQTVLTGNIAPNARLKLEAFGLAAALDLDAGAYGREERDRGNLLPLAWERQRVLRGRTFTPDETWIIGDTPRDLACASLGGAHCLLVGTGRFSADELGVLGADAVLESLADTAHVVGIVTGDRPTTDRP